MKRFFLITSQPHPVAKSLAIRTAAAIRVVTTTEESPTPMIGKIPYIGKSFSNIVSVQFDRHVLVLMMPSMVRE